jgi:hypothetical protein
MNVNCSSGDMAVTAGNMRNWNTLKTTEMKEEKRELRHGRKEEGKK